MSTRTSMCRSESHAQSSRSAAHQRPGPFAAAAATRIGSARGFTLIELLIGVAIVAILAVIAFPSYQAYLMKGRRAHAEAFLMDLAQRQQQVLLDRRSYAPDLASLHMAVPPDIQTFYTIEIDATKALVAAPQPAFTITANAIGAQAGDGDLRIDNLDNKLPAGKW